MRLYWKEFILINCFTEWPLVYWPEKKIDTWLLGMIWDGSVLPVIPQKNGWFTWVRVVQTLHLGSKLLFLPFFSFSTSFWHSSFPCGDFGAVAAPCRVDSLAGVWDSSSSKPGLKCWLRRHMGKHRASVGYLERNGLPLERNGLSLERSSSAAFRG